MKKIKNCPKCGIEYVTYIDQKHCSMECSKVPPPERFMKFINKHCGNGCWEWTGVRHGKGYGQFQFAHKITIKAHRYSYELFNGPIGDKHVLHKCDNPPCVNPDHLFLGTNADNVIDRNLKNRTYSKLSKEQVLEIRRLINLKFSYEKIANEFDISVSNIYRIAKGIAWKEV